MGSARGLAVPSPQEGKDRAKGLESEHSRDWEGERTESSLKFENKLNVTPQGAPPKGVDSFRAKPGEGPGARVEDSAFGSQSSGSGRANRWLRVGNVL